MMSTPLFSNLRTIPLMHSGTCEILGIGINGTLYVEEFYDDMWVAQHEMTPTGEILRTTDERGGRAALHPLHIPQDAHLRQYDLPLDTLAYDAGAALTGDRAEDRITSLVYPGEPPEKMRFADWAGISLFTFIGLSRSVILSAVAIRADHMLVCRRLDMAVISRDNAEHFETVTRHVLQVLSMGDEHTPLTTDGQVNDGSLRQPVQCTIHDRLLYIADAGGADEINRIHVYEIHTPI